MYLLHFSFKLSWQRDDIWIAPISFGFWLHRLRWFFLILGVMQGALRKRKARFKLKLKSIDRQRVRESALLSPFYTCLGHVGRDVRLCNVALASPIDFSPLLSFPHGWVSCLLSLLLGDDHWLIVLGEYLL
jgi:hypothetical protein